MSYIIMLVSIMSVSLSSVVSSVTRCWSKKQPKCFQNVALKQPMQLLHMSEVFRNSPKSCQSFGLLLLKNLLHRTFKNRSIWSHWLCHTALSLIFLETFWQLPRCQSRFQSLFCSNLGILYFQHFIYDFFSLT